MFRSVAQQDPRVTIKHFDLRGYKASLSYGVIDEHRIAVEVYFDRCGFFEEYPANADRGGQIVTYTLNLDENKTLVSVSPEPKNITIEWATGFPPSTILFKFPVSQSISVFNFMDPKDLIQSQDSRIILIIDTLGVTHECAMLFSKTEQYKITLKVLVDSRDSIKGVVGEFDLTVDEHNKLLSITPEPFLDINWTNGSEPSHIALNFPIGEVFATVDY